MLQPHPLPFILPAPLTQGLYINPALTAPSLPVRLRITGMMEGMVSPLFMIALLLFILLVLPPPSSPLLADACYRQNVDDVSGRISNLDITTATENSQSKPLAIEAHPPTSLGHPATTTFLSLPWLVKSDIYTQLLSKDCIALSSTCRQMYDFITFAYTHLQFLPPNSLFSLARSVHRLAEVLACSPHYGQAVRTLSIVGWNAFNVPDGYDIAKVSNSLDEGVAIILKNAPHIYSLTLDLNLTKTVHCFSRTFATLTRVRTVRNLHLATFLASMRMTENDTLQELERIPDGQARPAFEQLSLGVCSGAGLPVIMQNPRNLRWFGFTVVDKGWKRGHNNWTMTLQRIADAATKLETLVLENGEHFDANSLGQMLQSGFVRVVSEAVISVPVADHE